MRIIVTRPMDDAEMLRRELEQLGHSVIVQPLLSVVPRSDQIIPDLPWQIIVATSANAIRSLKSPDRLRRFPMLTVGPQSLAAAHAAQFDAQAHGGDIRGLTAHIIATLTPRAGPILYLSGAETSGDLKGQLEAAGFTCYRVVLYDAQPTTDLGAVEAAVRDGTADAVMLYSPRSARIWHKLVEKAGLTLQAAALPTLCLSRNVAAALPTPWSVQVAEMPENAAMLRLLEELQRTR